jgi:hypothetical protein
MTAVSPGHSTYNRRRVHPAVGTAAAAMAGVTTVSVGAQFLGVTPPVSDTSPYCAEAYRCLQPGAGSTAPTWPCVRSFHTDPRCGIPGCCPRQSPARTPAPTSDPRLHPLTRVSGRAPIFDRHRLQAMSPK